VEDVKPVGLSGTKRGNMYENANELETNNKNKISDTYIQA